MNTDLGRWERLLRNNDDLQIWKAINWRGEYEGKSNSACPSDEEFKIFFEQTFNSPDDLWLPDQHLNYEVSIPLLDEPITPYEVQQQINILKADKACGPDGVSPGIFKILPFRWILMLTTLFNSVFSSGAYPQA